MKNNSRLPKDYIFSRYKDLLDAGYRYDLHYKSKNIGYVLTKKVEGLSKGEIWLDGLHISKAFQGKGLGTLLMKKVESFNKGKTIRLRARPYKGKELSTKSLVEFYMRLGYKIYDTPNRMFKKIK